MYHSPLLFHKETMSDYSINVYCHDTKWRRRMSQQLTSVCGECMMMSSHVLYSQSSQLTMQSAVFVRRQTLSLDVSAGKMRQW